MYYIYEVEFRGLYGAESHRVATFKSKAGVKSWFSKEFKRNDSQRNAGDVDYYSIFKEVIDFNSLHRIEIARCSYRSKEWSLPRGGKWINMGKSNRYPENE